MKSIIEQASSIIKAVEKAWSRAGNPDEFSIKIFETEEKNFFGLTSKPAKVGIFFNETPSKTTTTKQPQKSFEKKVEKIEAEQKPQISKKHPEIKEKTIQPIVEKSTGHGAEKATPKQVTKKNQPPLEQQTASVPKQKTTWDSAMVDAASQWINTALAYIGISSAEFSTQISGKYLRITFNKPLFETPERNKQLFRSFSYLIIASLRNQFKQEVKDLKIVIVAAEQ